MKVRNLLLAALLCVASVGFAQTKQAQAKPVVQPTKSMDNKHLAMIDSLMSRIDTLVQINNIWFEQIELDQSLKERYKLYPADNLYTLLQLDTKTGKIEQVQWPLDSDQEGTNHSLYLSTKF